MRDYTWGVAKHYVITGGAGFIGSHFVDELLSQGNRVTVVDNLCSGTINHIAHHSSNPNFLFIEGDISNTELLCDLFSAAQIVIHLASNPDIARAAREPRIDFLQGTILTESVAEAARIVGIQTIIYASGSGVYGDAGEKLLSEESPTNPISTYGASKLGGESLLSAYSYMFGIKVRSFRFANVVGARQTHGVGFDFINRLKKNSHELLILGDGLQSKPYIHVSDVVKGVLLADEKCDRNIETFNLSTVDTLTVNEIAEEAMKTLEIDSTKVRIVYSGGSRGWKADVPVVRLSAKKIGDLGWKPMFTSQEAIKASLRSIALWKPNYS
jgi:UDP-glucose 4-epimerase